MTESKAHILLVEDHHANIIVATALLEDFGYAYSVARNGEEAVQLVRRQAFDLVLMDIQMPGIDGFEATRRIRQWETEQHSHCHLSIIGMTAHALMGDRERCLSAGMDDSVAKPVYPHDFQSKLEKWLNVKQAMHANA